MADTPSESCALPSDDARMKEGVEAEENRRTGAGPVFIVVMGVSGTGKSTLGSALARALDIPYVEGDELHPHANVAKMAAGIPLEDADREPWLALVRATAVRIVGEMLGEGKEKKEKRRRLHGVVISCSALKVYYRDILRGKLEPTPSASSAAPQADTPENFPIDAAAPTPVEPSLTTPTSPHLPTYFVFINGDRGVLLHRMERRPGHYMKAGMLDSQLRTLEDPTGEQDVVVVPLENISTEEQVRLALRGLGRLAGEAFGKAVEVILDE